MYVRISHLCLRPPDRNLLPPPPPAPPSPLWTTPTSTASCLPVSPPTHGTPPSPLSSGTTLKGLSALTHTVYTHIVVCQTTHTHTFVPCTCTHTHTHIHTHTQTHTHTHTRTHTHTHARTHTRKHTQTHTHTHRPMEEGSEGCFSRDLLSGRDDLSISSASSGEDSENASLVETGKLVRQAKLVSYIYTCMCMQYVVCTCTDLIH